MSDARIMDANSLHDLRLEIGGIVEAQVQAHGAPTRLASACLSLLGHIDGLSCEIQEAVAVIALRYPPFETPPDANLADLVRALCDAQARRIQELAAESKQT